MSLIDVRGVSYSYKGKVALSDLALQIEEGSFVVILGPNGSGKSTLSRILNATLEPSFGSIFVCGRECKDRESRFAARMNVGLVLQNPDSQIVGDTVEDDVAFALENMGLGREEMERRIVSSLSSTGLTHLRFADPRCLSGGQIQMLAIAGVLAMQCRCLVLDEALSMLDAKSKKEILNLLHNLNREKGLTVVLFTHNADEALDADVVHLLVDGRIVESGDPRSVLISDAARNHIRGSFAAVLADELRQKGLSVPQDAVTEDEIMSFLMGGSTSA